MPSRRGGRGAPPGPPVGHEALTYALGNLGGRQKSWMTTGQAPPLNTLNRPSNAPQKRGREEHTQAGQVSIGDNTHRQPLSNSTSPQLANVVSHRTDSQPFISPTTVLPSPSPSEDTNQDYYTPAQTTTTHGDGLRNISNETLRNSTSTNNVHYMPQNASPEAAFIEGARQAAVPKRPTTIGASPTLANKRMRPSVDPRTRPLPSPLQIQNANVDQHTLGQLGSGGQIQSASPTVNQSFGPVRRQHTQSQSPYQQHAIPPRPPSRPHSNQNGPTSPPVQSPFGPPHQSPLLDQGTTRNKSQMPTWPPALLHVQALSLQALDRFASMNDLPQASSDSKRIKALEMALKDHDWDYLMIHLFYCLLTLNEEGLPDAVSSSPHVPATKEFLSEVLDVNDYLQPLVKQFFMQFPMPLGRLVDRYPEQYNTDLVHFINLMTRAGSYHTLKKRCDERDTPPLMHELVHDMGIKSKLLQRIVFTANIRRLWSRWGLNRGIDSLVQHYEDEAMQLFTTMQNSFYSRLAQSQQKGQNLQLEREAEAQDWVAPFTTLRKKYAAQTRQVLQNQNAHHQMLYPQHQQEEYQQYQQHQQQQQYHHQPQPEYQLQHHPPPLAQTQAKSQPQPVLRPKPLLPPAGYYQPQQHQPNPARFGLHQAHLRSANLQSKARDRLYLYTQSFLREPQHLTEAGHKVERWHFVITPEQFSRIPKETSDKMGSPPLRIVDEKSLLLRLRCVKWTSKNEPNEHSWATSDTSWIPYSNFTLNDKSLEQRKKLYYGKDLPIDITSLVKEGENVLDIAIVRKPNDNRYRDYLLAIEILGVKTHDRLVEDIVAHNYVSAEGTKQRIKDKLLPTTGDDDDDIAFVNSSLTIKLFDPFSGSKMCDIPARGRACEHFDCFDLVTFLETRKKDGDSTVPDVWKCPICNGDARPVHLVVDGFLQEVHEKLRAQGLSETRAIIMSEDGSWKPRVEALEGVADQDDDDAAPTNTGAQQSRPAPEVIDLGDSDDE
ncbi:hypothetical protein BU23DRAFT_532158 [Bimuria novae-zelandiae CBS 107.79]|uniref:SP-RING-type domain-containing protein n=1 Tax=Bimuria novae-zelandiae CBS 107.79 TaxID=1447943 RepID=A0A6A5VGH7_9PLEO|nr:hypothetical protein BU23DRAFT_532158 [Bimuria novae-zelandiae CBS 107.79]